MDEDGNAINPHIPQFMASAPWYLSNDGPSLKHQKNWKGGVEDTKVWYDRGAKVHQATKYRKGACENCGSMSHKTRDCLERPRGRGARWTGKAIAADDKVEDIRLVGFDAKRDRWNGYSSEEWTRQAERFERAAEMRAEVRRRELLERGEGEGAAASTVAATEEDKVAETEEAGFAKVEKAVRTVGGGATGTVRNLRIREDTAKYLLNLDLESAYYDPKSRSMRQDPNPDRDPSQKTFAGDNFVRESGSVGAFKALNAFAVTAYERGQAAHLQATPSQAEAAFRRFKARRQEAGAGRRQDVRDRYGDAAEPLTEEVAALRGSEAYAEYDASGRLLHGHEVVARSRYEEDVHPGNHTSVWGSWWHQGAWGYACCHQTVKNSYCTGSVAREAEREAEEGMRANLLEKAAEAREEAVRDDDDAAHGAATPSTTTIAPFKGGYAGASGLWGTETEEGTELDRDKVKAALKKQARLEREALERDQSKRGYNSLGGAATDEVTAEDMEAYRLKRARADDPLAAINQAKGTDGYDLV